MDAPAACRGDHLLSELADEDRPFADLREGFDDPDDVAPGDRSLETQEQIRRRQMEKVERVRLQHLAVVHQAPHLVGRGRHLVHARDDIHRLGGAQMMADRADAAETLDDDGDFPIHPALDEALAPPELDDVKARLFDFAGFIEPDGHLAMALHPRDRIDDDLTRAQARRL